MALTISNLANGTDTAADATLATGATVTASVGDVLLLCIAACNSGTAGVAPTISSIADNAGGSTNVYTQRGTTGNQTAGASNDGASQFWVECTVTTALSNNVITITFGANNAQKSVQVYKMVPAAAEKPGFIGVGTASAGAGRTTHSATTVSVENGHTIFAMAAIETDDAVTGDSDTTNGSWSSVLTRLADGGADASTMSCASQHKTVNATGNQAWACTTALGRDSVANTIIYAAVKVITAAAGSYGLTGTDAATEFGREVAAAVGAYALTGSPATLSKGQTLAAGAGSYALTGVDTALEFNREVAAAAGSYALSGTDAAPELGREVVAAAGGYALTGTDAALEFGREVAAASGSYVLTGAAAGLQINIPLTAAAGGYALSGSAAGLTVGIPLAAGAGAYVMNGSDAALEFGREVAAAAGSYALSGAPAALEYGREITAGAGSYVLTGVDATLIKSAGAITLTAEAGSYALTGAAASLEYGREVAIDTGSHTLSGIDANLEFGREVLAAAGAYALSGVDAALERGREVEAAAGAYSLGGAGAALELGRLLAAAAGGYVLNGGNATLTLAGAASPTIIHDGDDTPARSRPRGAAGRAAARPEAGVARPRSNSTPAEPR